MVTIRIRDHLARASTNGDGDVVYNLVRNALLAGGRVAVSFDGIFSVPTAFVNSAFVQLLDDVSFDDLQARVRFLDSTRSINDLLRSRLRFAAEQKANELANEEHQAALTA